MHASHRTVELGTVELAGSSVRRRRHVRAFFHSRSDEDAVYVLNPAQKSERVAWLGRRGIDVEAAGRNGQLDVRPWGDAYLRGGAFSQDAMIGLLEQRGRRSQTPG